MMASDSQPLYLVNHGKSGGFGCFVADLPLSLQRGAEVVIETARGLEAGTVVGPATQRHARLLGSILAGRLRRRFSEQDDQEWQQRQQLAQAVFDRARTVTGELDLPLEILDVEVLFDGSQAILQYLGPDDASL